MHREQRTQTEVIQVAGSELPVVQQQDVPGTVRELSTIADPDYVDLFTLVTGAARAKSPEQWARAVVDDVAGLPGQVLWRGVLGLRLKASPACVGGWRIADRADRWVRLEADSWMLAAQLVFVVDDEGVSLATFLRYDRPVAAPVWTSVSVLHRQQVPALLRKAHDVRMVA